MSFFKLYDQYGVALHNLTQWDSNAIITIPNFAYTSAPMFHFANTAHENSLTVQSTLDKSTVSVVVPNILLTKARPIDIYVFLYDVATEEGRAIDHVTLPVIPKPKPNDYEYVDNTEVVELNSLRLQLEALIAETDRTVTSRVKELSDAYDATVQGIRDDIASDVTNLNNSIAANRDELSSDITHARTALEADVASALATMIDSVDDGSPRGVFTDIADLAEMPAGVYLFIDATSDNNGYIYYWDGVSLSDRLLYYAGMVINDGSITYEKLSNDLKKQAVSEVIEYTLTPSGWNELTHPIDISATYTITAHTKADIDIDSALFGTLRDDGCFGMYIETENENGASLVAHAIGNPPLHNVTIQITIKETK